MTSAGLLIGHRWSFLLITLTQWAWVLGFLFLVEEPELRDKFGQAYTAYSRRTSILFPDLRCVVSVLRRPLRESRLEKLGEAFDQ